MANTENAPYLTGKLLLAMPDMMDPRFEKSVVFLCTHDANGAMGLVLNKVLTDIRMEHLLDELGLVSDITLDLERLSLPVMNGGPVETGRGFLLHSSDFDTPQTIQMNDFLNLTGTVDALKTIASGNGPEHVLFFLGYAGWGPGQLDQELQKNAWIIADPDPDIVFKEDHQSKWDTAFKKLGIDPTRMSSEYGSA